MAFDATRRKSGHAEEYKFPARGEALAFLRSSRWQRASGRIR